VVPQLRAPPGLVRTIAMLPGLHLALPGQQLTSRVLLLSREHILNHREIIIIKVLKGTIAGQTGLHQILVIIPGQKIVGLQHLHIQGQPKGLLQLPVGQLKILIQDQVLLLQVVHQAAAMTGVVRLRAPGQILLIIVVQAAVPKVVVLRAQVAVQGVVHHDQAVQGAAVLRDHRDDRFIISPKFLIL
jgi:hypothetical protein